MSSGNQALTRCACSGTNPTDESVTPGLPVILPQLQETMFANLQQSLLRSPNQGHSALLQLCY
jgi:hypothetical protein